MESTSSKTPSSGILLPKISAELFAKMRTNKDGPEFDDAEAGMVIIRIERCAVANGEREGINYRIEMEVPGAAVGRDTRISGAERRAPRQAAYLTRRLCRCCAHCAQVGRRVRGRRATGNRG